MSFSFDGTYVRWVVGFVLQLLEGRQSHQMEKLQLSLSGLLWQPQQKCQLHSPWKLSYSSSPSGNPCRLEWSCNGGEQCVRDACITISLCTLQWRTEAKHNYLYIASSISLPSDSSLSKRSNQTLSHLLNLLTNPWNDMTLEITNLFHDMHLIPTSVFSSYSWPVATILLFSATQQSFSPCLPSILGSLP